MDPINLTLRGAKGSPLTFAEEDGNKAALKTAIEQVNAEKLPIDAAVEVTDALTDLEGSDQMLVLRGGVAYLATLAAVQAFVGGTPSATAPAAFTVGQWTATAGLESIELNITALAADGGSALTALQYRLNGGAAVNLAGAGTGVRTITGLTGGTAYDVQIRAVNAIGAGAWSDIKARTPTASATAPAAFVTGQWSVAATGASGAIAIDITALPSNGGSAITALQYRIDGGAATALTGTGTGSRTITGLANGVEVDIQLRAVNAVGAGAWGDVKAVTPAVSGGGTPGELRFGTNSTDNAALVAGFFNQYGSFFIDPENLDISTSKPLVEWSVGMLSPALAGSLPAGATITSVTVEGSIDFIWQDPVLQVRQALRAVVVEAFTPGQANYAPSSPWAAPSGSGAGDLSAVLASVALPESGNFVVPSTPEIVAAVQAWANGSRSAPLWLYLGTGGPSGADSRIHGVAAAIADGGRLRVRVGYTA